MRNKKINDVFSKVFNVNSKSLQMIFLLFLKYGAIKARIGLALGRFLGVFQSRALKGRGSISIIGRSAGNCLAFIT